MFKTFHLDSVAIQWSITLWSNDTIHAMVKSPACGQVKQGIRDFLVVNTIKKVELAVFCAVIFMESFPTTLPSRFARKNSEIE